MPIELNNQKILQNNKLIRFLLLILLPILIGHANKRGNEVQKTLVGAYWDVLLVILEQFYFFN